MKCHNNITVNKRARLYINPGRCPRVRGRVAEAAAAAASLFVGNFIRNPARTSLRYNVLAAHNG